MHIAAFNGFLESVRTLIEYDASTRVVDRYGRDALYLAAGRGHTAVSELLLQQLDTRANATDIRGWTPLFWAAGNGHGGAVSLLARYGADVDIRDRNGITPLHWAARKEQLEVVEILLLLKAHGSTNITGGKGEINQSKSDLAKLAKLLVAMMRQKSSLELWRGYEETMPEV
ncbi:ankyrin repeat-containing domain protein [Aspergillus karnatakaensis]|uniref:ankyrin repeat domain-containing protein n=1 Tax=Aspergillus karnatakaensis TaxID=1810916 RepID=UPI003CCDB24F